MEENVLDTEVEVTEEVTDTFEEVEEVAEDGDNEFEYDDEGNIVIPDVEFDEDELLDEDSEETEEEPTEEAEEESEEENTSSDADDAAPPSPQGEGEQKPAEEVPAEPDPRDAEIESLRKRLQKIESQSKDTLKKLGKNSEDIIEGLIELAAEVDDQTPAEYKEKREKEERELAARQMMQNQLFEAKAASDLKELHDAYPETQKYKHIRDLPDGVRQEFGKYRDLGLSAKKAYAAANPDGIRTDTATAVKKQVQHASKDHLKSSVPKPSKSNAVSMSKAELAYWKELFPDKSTAEIQKIYKETL